MKNAKAKEEFLIIRQIAQRAVNTLEDYPMLDALMDIQAAHEIRPLRLDELASAPEPHWSHDIAGIRQHLDRETKTFAQGFVPRYARPLKILQD